VRALGPGAGGRPTTTPTLVIHSEEDWRCPLEQGARLFVELKRRGVPTELLLFPGASHELSRSGRPRHRLARFEHILRWWARWLPTAQNPADGRAVESGSASDAPPVDGSRVPLDGQRPDGQVADGRLPADADAGSGDGDGEPLGVRSSRVG
jgi:hypothetical protein